MYSIKMGIVPKVIINSQPKSPIHPNDRLINAFFPDPKKYLHCLRKFSNLYKILIFNLDLF